MAFKKSYRRYGRKLASSMPASVMRSTAGLSAGAKALLRQQQAAKARNYVSRQTAKRISRIRKTKKQTAGSGIKEFDTKVLFTGKRVSPTVYRNKLVSSGVQPVRFQYRGLKNFDDNGFYQCNQSLSADKLRRDLPVYALLLNGVNQSSAQRVRPLRRLYAYTQGGNDGRLAWRNSAGLDKNGNSYDQLLYSTATSLSDVHARALWQSSSVKLVLWGSKAKCVKWIVQIVAFRDDECAPHHWATDAVMTTNAQQFWETQLKQLTFNPIETFDWGTTTRKMRVLKTYTVTLQPTQTTEVDTDPKAHILKWYQKWNRQCNYDTDMDAFGNVSRMTDDNQLSTVVNNTDDIQYAYSVKPRPNEQVYMLIRCNDYSLIDSGVDPATVFSNNIHGSFDLSFASRFNKMD